MVKVIGMTISTLDMPSGSSTAYSIATNDLNVGPEIDWDPEHLVLSAWMEHVPFAFWLMKVLRPTCFVELGTERGVSYAAFCQAVERFETGSRCYAVDTWRGDEHAGHYDESVYHQIADLNDRRFRRFSTLLRTTFAEALPYFSDGEIDLLHIDGLHTYEAVAEDFRTWRPKLSSRAVVLFHDTNVRRDDFGVWRLWQELKAQYPHFEFAHGYGLGVIGVGEDLPAPIRALFHASERDDLQVAVQGLFAARGRAIHLAYDLNAAHQRTATVSGKVASLQQEAAALRDQSAALLNELATLRQQLEAAQAAAAANQTAVATSQAAAAASQAATEATQTQLAVTQAEVSALRQQLAAGSDEADALRAQLAVATDEVKELNQRLLNERAQALAEQVRLSGQVSDAAAHYAGVEAQLRAQLALAEARCSALLTSTSWRVTAPLRAVKTAVSDVPPGPIALTSRPEPVDGWKERLGGLYRRAAGTTSSQTIARPPRVRKMPSASQTDLLQLRVLIVAELSVPQCKKYRVDQKHDMIVSMGWDCTIVPWHESERVMTLLQTHSMVIFYRVPAVPSVLQCIDEAAALGLPHYFEVDDLIFDIDDYAANPNLVHLDAPTANGLFAGAMLYREALQRCRNVIASTPFLAERMQATGGGSSIFIENALDAETMEAAVSVRHVEDGRISIIYGSGTRTHDADLAEVAPALKRIAVEHGDVDIVLVGELDAPQDLRELGDRLRRLPACPYHEYLGLLAAADIAIAPLAPVKFNEAKSNIKFLEAAAVGLPSVCSPRSAFAHAIRHGETGLLADTTDEWYAALKSLVINPDLRSRMGRAARQDVFEQYSPESIGYRQLRPLLLTHQPPPDNRFHILLVNVLYHPQSFGGATIVMEEVIRQLQDRPDTRISVFTRAPAGWLKPYAVERGEENGVSVFRIGIQDPAAGVEVAWDETVAEIFPRCPACVAARRCSFSFHPKSWRHLPADMPPGRHSVCRYAA